MKNKIKTLNIMRFTLKLSNRILANNIYDKIDTLLCDTFIQTLKYKYNNNAKDRDKCK